jgi:DNA-directed RNA polymerase subunit omega
MIVARVTIEDCLKNVDNRFTLVHLAAKRVRQVREGAELLVKSSNNGDVVSVLREIAAGRVIAKRKEDPENK